MKNLLKLTISLFLVMTAYNAQALDASKANQFIEQGDHAFSNTLYRKALINYQKAMRHAADQESVKVKIAESFLRLKEYSTAMQVVDEVLGSNSANPRALHVKGQVFEETNRNRKALEYYNEASVYQPNNERLDIDRANALRKLNFEVEASAITQMLDQKRLNKAAE